MELSFELFAEQHGLIIDNVVHDRWTRVPTVDKPMSRNGSYIYNGKSGAVQNWAIHESPVVFKGKGENRLSVEEIRQKKLKAEKIKAQKNNRAIAVAKNMLDNAVKKTHPYMVKKGFPDFKVPVHEGMMLLPMRIGQDLVGLQTISADGEKKFLYGQITKGAELCIDAKGMHILCEGYATAMSLRKVLKYIRVPYTIHVCFSAGNIKEMAKHYPQCLIIADNDPVGLKVAKDTGKKYWTSPVAGEDFNDFEMRVGVKESGKTLTASGLLVASD
jgi:putative DNA primase/helicase